ncbi:ATP-binding protein [bacterium]|nr:ATP-binding protein [bacterium]
MMITRYLENKIQQALTSDLYPAIILYGARQVGKTTLLKQLTKKTNLSHRFFACDDPAVADMLSGFNVERLKRLIGSHQLLIFDEAQTIKNIGLLLKLIVDNISGVKMLVSGSSSFELANQISEPLTGRKITYTLYPLALSEIYQPEQLIEQKAMLPHFLQYGFYPKTLQFKEDSDIELYLNELSRDYLYKDAVQLQLIKNNESMQRLIMSLALQIGQEVSYTELSRTVGIDQKTVIRYVDLLEKSFIIFKLPAFSRNQRNEINKSRKIYFYDLGIRNALIKNFNGPSIRADIGALWENFLIIERMKNDAAKGLVKNYYFWRNYAKQEIDWIEEYSGELHGYEFKWKSGRTKASNFLESYPGSTVETITQDNVDEFI